MLNGAVTNRYTEGLFLTASEHGLADVVDENLATVVQVLKQYPELKGLLEHPMIGTEAKSGVIANVFGDSLDPVVKRFLRILFVRRRIQYIEAIQSAFHARLDEAKGRVQVLVETARPMTDAGLAEFRDELAKSLQKQVEAKVTVNPDLIAGYRLQIGNRVLDATLKGALSQFSEKLLVSGAVKEGTL